MFLFHLIALIKLLLRPRPHAPRRLSGLEIKTNEQKEEGALQRNLNLDQHNL